jgi:hypothetical protein
MSFDASKKFGLIAIALAILPLFLPVVPIARLGVNDPQNIRDSRIEASLTEDDLSEILSEIRGGRFSIPPYAVLLNRIGLMDSLYPLLSIHQTPNQPEVTVATGFRPSPLGGSGMRYRLIKVQNQWKIVDSVFWNS